MSVIMNKKYTLLLLLLLPLLWACNNEAPILQGGSVRTRRMIFDGEVVGYTPATRAASVRVPQGAVMYLQLGSVTTTATYDGSEWTLALPDNLADKASGTCTAYYFESASVTGTQVSLFSSRPQFKGTGTFSNSQEALTITTSLRPMSMRLHFRGTPGAQITVSGLEGNTSFDASSHELTSGALSTTLTVQSDGYTPYVHGQLSSSRTLKVSDGTYTYTRTFSSSVMREGESGYLDIPTPTSHEGWTSDEKSDIDFSGGDYGNETDWNQPDKEPDTDVDFSGGDYGSETDWNQPDKEPETDVDFSGGDYDGENDWNQPDKEPETDAGFSGGDYGNETDWNQPDPPKSHEYVDLGLSVKWATCNVGADNPEDYGDYYAWGETATKSSYSWSTYLDSPNRDGNSFTKYKSDGKAKLDLENDVAYVKWGGSWRMPTDGEWTELRTKCTWTWDSTKKGYKITSSNGNSIILPAAGYRNSGELSSSGLYGEYWSSTLNTSYPDNAWYMSFESGRITRSNGSRRYGRSVRPVCP